MVSDLEHDGALVKRDDSALLDKAAALAARESGLAVVFTVRDDSTPHASVVNAAIVTHPVTGDRVAGFVIQGAGRSKLAHVRARPVVSVVFRSGWEWVAVEGRADLFGPNDTDVVPWPDSAPVFHAIYVASLGGAAEEWAANDEAITREGHAAVLVVPHRVYGRLAGAL